MVTEGRLLKSRQYGFTLLEVLIAGFILFLVLTSMTQVYRGALLASGKAEKTLSLVASVPAVRIIITEAITESMERSGEGSHGEVSFTWTAALAYEGLPSLDLLRDAPSTKYYLWDVDLKVTQGDLARQYECSEISK